MPGEPPTHPPSSELQDIPAGELRTIVGQAIAKLRQSRAILRPHEPLSEFLEIVNTCIEECERGRLQVFG